MKKLMYFATALLVLAGCNNKDNALNNTPEGTPFKKGQQVTLTIGTGNNANQVTPRKVTGIDNTTDGLIEFRWEEDDQILVKVGQKSAVFTLSSEPGLEYGEFTGTMPADGSTFDIQYPITTPTGLGAQVYTTTKTIPANKMLFTATDCTLGNNAILQAQYAMVQLNLFGTDKTVGQIVFTNTTASPAESYTLTCTGGKTIGATSATATPFYMVVSAGEYQFEVAVYDNATTPAKICSFATSAAKTFTAGECLNMPAKEVKEPFVPTYVDLGLPSGLKWATCNLGATTPEGYGDYFAWGEVEPYYSSQDPLTWKTGKESGYAWQSYCGSSSFSEWSTAPYDATTKILKPEFDAATVNWGGNWRMPTYAELDELKTKCNWKWTQKNGINGYEVEGPNKNTIFLPASGCRGGSLLDNVGSYGDCWSSSLDGSNSGDAYYLYFGSGDVGWSSYYRFNGFSVRPVID